MVINKEMINQELIELLIRVFQLPEVNKISIKEIDINSIDEIDQISKGIEECYHDVLSDIDVGIHVTLHPHDINKGQGYISNPERIGLTRDNYLGLACSESNGGLYQMYRVILKSGIRFDIGFYIKDDTSAPIYHIPQKIKEEINDDGKIHGRWDLRKADTFWFVQIQALAKLKRGDYLIADHLAHMQINETLVAQMIERDDLYGTNFHRYGYKEDLEYKAVDLSSFPFQLKDETYNMIAYKIYTAALSYDKLIKRSNPRYEERSSNFFEIWEQYEVGTR